MRSTYILIGFSLIVLNSFSQSIPTAETIFSIHKKDKQQFEFSLQKGYTLNAVVEQIGIDLSISVYKKGDTSKLAYFDSPNGEYGLERIRFEGPIVELVNSITQSQAEYTTMSFQTSPDLTVIGSITAGADGNVSPIYLPGGIYSLISGIGVFYPDGSQTQRKGIKIDISVSPTIEGIKQGKDELLEKAIEIINSKK